MVEHLGVTELVSFLKENGFPILLADAFFDHRITGSLFLALSERDIEQLSPRLGDRMRIRGLLKKLRKVSELKWIAVDSNLQICCLYAG